MSKILLFDFSRVLLFPKDKEYVGGLNSLYKGLSATSGFHFLDHFYLNSELLSFLETVKNKDNLYMLTSEIIQNDPAVKPIISTIFKEIYSAKELGIHKTNPLLYQTVAQRLGKSPQDIIFVDDTHANIEAAKRAGLETIHYTSNEELIQNLKRCQRPCKG